jgi:hypothetical protein
MEFGFRVDYHGEHTIRIFNVTNDDVDKIPLLDSNITQLVIQNDYLDNFTIPSGITTASVSYLGLKTLVIPDGIEYIYCSHNFLRTLELPASIVHVVANNNLLTHITFRGFPKDLYHIDIRNNRISYLDVPISPSLEYLNAAFNPCVHSMSKCVSSEVLEYLKKQDDLLHMNSESEDDIDWVAHMRAHFM